MFAIQTILHPTDLQNDSAAAFQFACALARDYGARLIVLHVYDPPRTYAEFRDFRRADGAEEDLWTALYALRPTDRSVDVEYQLIEGKPADAIVEIASDEFCDLIVIGSHGRAGVSRALMGSVAESVCRHAGCPVVTVRPDVKFPPTDADSQRVMEPATNDVGGGD